MTTNAIDKAIAKEFGPGMRCTLMIGAEDVIDNSGRQLTAYYSDGNQRLIVDVSKGVASVFTFHRTLKPC